MRAPLLFALAVVLVVLLAFALVSGQHPSLMPLSVGCFSNASRDIWATEHLGRNLDKEVAKLAAVKQPGIHIWKLETKEGQTCYLAADANADNQPSLHWTSVSP